MTPATTFTAAQIATALGITPQAVRQQLRGVAAAGRRRVRGNEAAVYEMCQLPAPWQKTLQASAERGLYRNPESFMANPPRRWQPPLPWEKICAADVKNALANRDIFRPWLASQHDPALTSAQMDAAGVEDYYHLKRVRISQSYFRKLFNRFVERDAGLGDWDEPTIYLPVHPRPKEILPAAVPAELANEFEKLEYHIKNNIGNPAAPTKEECKGVWKLTLVKHAEMLRAGETQKSATRRVLQFLFARAKFLAPSVEALRKAFELRLANGIEDRRKSNGNRAKYPLDDLERLRHLAFDKHGGRIDAAWRESYKKLSDYTRQRHPFHHKCPRTLKEAVNRLKVDTLLDAAHSEKRIRNRVGRLTLNHDGIMAMDKWSVDDVTSDIQASFQNPAGTISLILPQIIAVMDNASRKILTCKISNNKGPTSRLVKTTVKQAIKDFGVPGEIGLENGWVFGKSLNINGKEDENGQMIVAGLTKYGCVVRHYLPRSPTSKADLENSFNSLQRRMEGHYGYTGRNQRTSASDDFKREEKLIRDGKVEVAECRYTFDEFVCVIQEIVDDYNNSPQPYGRLKGQTPNQAFMALKNPVRETKFSPELHWLLDEQTRVTVKAGGVNFTLYGRDIQVRAGELLYHVGEEFWALVDDDDDSTVTFMSLDFMTTFTQEVCSNPSADEIRIAGATGLVGVERRKIAAHIRHAKDQVKDLREKYGNTRQDLLAQVRNHPGDGTPVDAQRRLMIDPQMLAAGEQLNEQREDIRQQRKEIVRQQRQAETIAAETGLDFPADGVAGLTPAQLRKLKSRTAGQKQYE